MWSQPVQTPVTRGETPLFHFAQATAKPGSMVISNLGPSSVRIGFGPGFGFTDILASHYLITAMSAAAVLTNPTTDPDSTLQVQYSL